MEFTMNSNGTIRVPELSAGQHTINLLPNLTRLDVINLGSNKVYFSDQTISSTGDSFAIEMPHGGYTLPFNQGDKLYVYCEDVVSIQIIGYQG